MIPTGHATAVCVSVIWSPCSQTIRIQSSSSLEDHAHAPGLAHNAGTTHLRSPEKEHGEPIPCSHLSISVEDTCWTSSRIATFKT